jgi:bacterioferritin (cytochrome b1)
MKTFISFADPLEMVVNSIVASDALHAKWLNTLSYLENCGARKIAACEHPTLVKEEILKHAAEEFRHAYHLKRQIKKVPSMPLETYSVSNILGRYNTLHYLTALDLKTSRYLKKLNQSKQSIRAASYLLVTYAIELRANELYAIYDGVLRKNASRVSVKSILLEEEEHLNEMHEGLRLLANGYTHAEYVCEIEGRLFKSWLENVQNCL